jgi:hypothetical protein
MSHYHMREVATHLNPVEWVVNSWVVFELFSRWSRSYKGIGRFGRLLLAVLLAVGLAISMAFWPMEWKALVFAQNFRVYYILDRVVWVTLALFVLGMWLFFRNYPVVIAPNVTRHAYIALLYFLPNALSYLLFTLYGRAVVAQINLAIVLSTTASFCAWAVLLTRKGQIVPAAQRVSAEDRDRIERINQELLVFMGDFPKNNR